MSFRSGGPLIVSLKDHAIRPLASIVFEIVYDSADGKTRLAAARTGERGERLRIEPPGGTLEFTCVLPLEPGGYYIGALVRDLSTGKTLAWWDGETRLYVGGEPVTDARLHIPHAWRHVQGVAGTSSPARECPQQSDGRPSKANHTRNARALRPFVRTSHFTRSRSRSPKSALTMSKSRFPGLLGNRIAGDESALGSTDRNRRPQHFGDVAAHVRVVPPTRADGMVAADGCCRATRMFNS